MRLTTEEVKTLKKIAEANLITKTELKKFLSENGGVQQIDSLTRSLQEKQLITMINPIGSTCFIITQRGSRFIQNL